MAYAAIGSMSLQKKGASGMFIDFPESDVKVQGLDEVSIPSMYTVRQKFDDSKVDDVVGTLQAQLDALPNHDSYAGKRIALTVGSRGIPHLVDMVRCMCDTLKSWGALPFIVPSMGSHGGATAQGQLEMLAGYGITPESIGVPIPSSMDVVQYAELDGIPLYCDANAAAADGIVIFNKVKPHTEFRGEHESGLAKMIAIGIAKHKGAAMFHSFGFDRFGELIPQVAEKFVAHMPVVFGVGVVQNAFDDICAVEVCEPHDLLACDKRLLRTAFDRMAKFLFDHIDLLIIDEVGKNISGNGHDPNITGRNLAGNFSQLLDLKKLMIRSITEVSHHHGAGLACADVVTRKLLSSVDWGATWTNVMTTGVTAGAKIPFYTNTEEEAVRVALRTCPGIDLSNPRVVRIVNTLEMDKIQVSKAIYDEIREQPDIEYVSGPISMEFDGNGDIVG